MKVNDVDAIDCIFYFRYNNLLESGEGRREKLNESCKAYQLVREAGELAQWISDKEAVVIDYDFGENLENVEGAQRKFGDFKKDMQANQARLTELNTIAERLTAMGQTEAAEKIQVQIETLNQRWAALEQVTKEKDEMLRRSHEVKMYHR